MGQLVGLLPGDEVQWDTRADALDGLVQGSVPAHDVILGAIEGAGLGGEDDAAGLELLDHFHGAADPVELLIPWVRAMWIGAEDLMDEELIHLLIEVHLRQRCPGPLEVKRLLCAGGGTGDAAHGCCCQGGCAGAKHGSSGNSGHRPLLSGTGHTWPRVHVVFCLEAEAPSGS